MRFHKRYKFVFFFLILKQIWFSRENEIVWKIKQILIMKTFLKYKCCRMQKIIRKYTKMCKKKKILLFLLYKLNLSYSRRLFCSTHLIEIIFKHILIGFGPEVYLDTAIGVRIFTANIAVVSIMRPSLGTPASTSFKFTKPTLVVENPTCEMEQIINLLVSIDAGYRLVRVWKIKITFFLKQTKKKNHEHFQCYFTLIVSNAMSNTRMLGSFKMSHSSL